MAQQRFCSVHFGRVGGDLPWRCRGTLGTRDGGFISFKKGFTSHLCVDEEAQRYPSRKLCIWPPPHGANGTSFGTPPTFACSVRPSFSVVDERSPLFTADPHQPVSLVSLVLRPALVLRLL
ncbi:hypothetical protein XA68_13202 [Ophiocordyceps unilateralis]|uniref:Uncharacterized protein n=1 Tax=Ophiocordyceps unilateralis TaxID=268505 RepID=A0A2A9PD92_OPHUN|nr:hypothetical protein XA68_13202 [Ophiocordyceps unilateralis]